MPLVVVYNVQRLLRPGGSAVARALDATQDHGWDEEAYRLKVAAVAAVLADATGGEVPAVLFLVEVEDASVVSDVTAAAGWPEMINVDVDAEQVDGYDVAIAYDPRVFSGHRGARSYTFENRFATRDLLTAPLAMRNGGALVVAATHWASRTMSEAEVLRIGAAIFCGNVLTQQLKYAKEDLIDTAGAPKLPSRDDLAARWRTPVLIAGDLNDSPWDRSVRTMLRSTPDIDDVRREPRLPTGSTLRSVAAYLRLRPRLFNPTWSVIEPAKGPRGTYRFAGEWSPIDQMLVSCGMLEAGVPGLVGDSLRVHAPTTVVATGGRIVRVRRSDGTPIPYDPHSHEGVSDHLPVLAEIDLG